MKHQHPKTASAIFYPIYIISDLGHMVVPQCTVGQGRWWFVDVLKGGGDMKGSLGWVPVA